MKQAVIVSGEMTALVGAGEIPPFVRPNDPVVLVIDSLATSPVLTFRDWDDLTGFDDAPLILVVERAACLRLFAVDLEGSQSWYLSSALVQLALSIIDCEATGEARTTLQLARSIELLCQIYAALEEGRLVPFGADGTMSELDLARIASARRLVDQRWQEKLTIAELSRAAGVNRDKLTKGFRDLYGASIAEVLSERRLSEARRLLLGSDLPVATVGYRCSYLNNASFTRAFTRRFGMPPSELRRTGVAA
jgi:AraC family transcriptional activator of pyochelin receptor